MSIIKEAFAGDDIIADFLKDKKKQEEAGKPKVVDLTLPGWGDWGGVGLKPPRYKRLKWVVQESHHIGYFIYIYCLDIHLNYEYVVTMDTLVAGGWKDAQ